MAKINYENPGLEGSLETEMFISRLNEDSRIKSITFGERKVLVDIGKIGDGQSLVVFSVRGKNLDDPAVASFLRLFDEGRISYDIEGMGENSNFIGVNLSLDELPMMVKKRCLKSEGGGPQLIVNTAVSVGKMEGGMEVVVKGGSVTFEKRGK